MIAVGSNVDGWVLDDIFSSDGAVLAACHHVDRPAVRSLLKIWSRSEGARQARDQEQRAGAQLSHPFVPAVQEAGEDEHRLYLRYPLVPGVPLASQRGGPSSRASGWVRTLQTAVDAIHRDGWVVGSLSPHTVFVGADDAVWLFGLDQARMTTNGPNRRADREAVALLEHHLLPSIPDASDASVPAGQASPHRAFWVVSALSGCAAGAAISALIVLFVELSRIR